MNNLKDKLPKGLRERVRELVAEDGLIDNCRYMLYLNDGWKFVEGGMSLPIRSIKEAISFLNDAEKMPL